MSLRIRLLALGVLLASLHSIVGAAEFPAPYNSEQPGAEPMSAAQAAASFKLPSGFKVSVFASEPDVRQPIAMTFDPRGRLWVAENYTYAESKVNFATNLTDRVLIFEDADHDGRFDQRTVFWDQAKVLTSVEVGLGGVFVLCPPKLLFLADRNGDDVPDGEPQVLLDGFDTTTGNRHTFANGLKWGPDGWLWGRIGISSGAKIGLPGTPAAGRVEMRGGIWRYHPTRHVFEAVSHGTTNPWGLDWDEMGEPFFINTVIGHLWHAIPGAHFQRMHGDDVDPHSYALIGQHADHFHFDTGAGWTKSRAAFDGSSFAAGSDGLGGGHAHSGLLIYQGDNWPAQYRGRLFTLNLHGRRVNQERLERRGSGYVGKHEPDLFSVGDPWFRGLDLLQGPDGGVFISDWSDTGECHDSDGVHRSSGRIYKVTYGEPTKAKFGDLTKLDKAQLLARVTSTNAWVARQTRRVMADRIHANDKEVPSMSQLKEEFGRHWGTVPRLQVVWALNAVGRADPDWLFQRIEDSTRDGAEETRSWAVRLLADTFTADQLRKPTAVSNTGTNRPGYIRPPLTPSRVAAAFAKLARTDRSPLVRLYLASALQHLPVGFREELAAALLAYPEHAPDHNLPLMFWQGVEPLVAAHPDIGVKLARASRHPLVRQFITRRLAEDLETAPAPLAQLLEFAATAATSDQADILRGLSEALRGWRKAKPPETWAAFAKVAAASADPEVRDRARELGVVFGDGRALDDLRRIVADPTADAAARRQAIRILVESRADGLAPLLKQVADDSVLRPAVLNGLIAIGDPEGPGRAAGSYQWLGLEERPALLGAMVTRPAVAKALLDAVGTGGIPRADLTPFLARQIAQLGDPALTKQLTTIWGTLRATEADKRATIDGFRARLTAERLRSASLPNGRRVFAQLCAPCHQLYGEGGQVGPDLTGSGRADLGYLLENLVDPSAVVPADYRMAIATLKDGRVLNGLQREPNDRTVTIQSQTERTTLERRDVASLELSEQSLMPDGVLEALPPDDARDLLGYLMHPTQVAPPAARK